MIDTDKLKARWRQRDGRATVNYRDLRAGRPEAPPVEGSPCERCGELTEEVQCAFGNYWICERCKRFFDGLSRWAERIRGS